MDHATNELKDWIKNHLKNRSLFNNNLKSISEKEGFLEASFTNKKQIIFIVPYLTSLEEFIKKTEQDKHHSINYSIICYNTRRNINEAIRFWKKLIKIRFLTIYFVNPQATDEQRWILNPHTHNFISDESNIKKGLLSLFESVHEWPNK